MAPYLFEHFGNPSSGHTFGRTCKSAVATARAQVAALIGASPDEVYFTACGTESDNWAIHAAVTARRAAAPHGGLPHVVTSAVEHPAVLEYLRHLEDQRLATFTMVPSNSEGVVCAEAVAAALREETALVTVMHSNNEVGTLQPVAQLAAAARCRGVLVHTDAAQSLGKVAVHVDDLGVDMLTLVGHKFGAPKGVAALYVRRGVPLPKFLHGGGQEGGRRAGTESVLLMVGLGAAADLAVRELSHTAPHMAAMRDLLQRSLLAAFRPEDVRIHGPADDRLRLPNTLSIGIRGLDTSRLLHTLADRLAASAGSACHSHDGPVVSPVLQAMQVPREFAVGTLRLSTGRHTTATCIHTAVSLIVQEARAQGVTEP